MDGGDDDIEVEKVIKASKCKISLKPITLEDIDRVANELKVNGMKKAVREYLVYGLKFDEEELKDLGVFEVSRRDIDDNDKVYLKFKNESSCEYIYRKAAICRNGSVNVFSYIPPQE